MHVTGSAGREKRPTSGVTRRRLIGFVGMGSTAVWLAACGGDQNKSGGATAANTVPAGGAAVPVAVAQKGGTLKLGGWGVRRFLSPRGATGGNYMDQDYVSGDSYVYVKSDGSFDPTVSLWEKWEQTDKQTIAATVRKGVQFHDGTPLNAEAVKAHLEFMSVEKNVPNYGFFSLLESFEKVEATDANTVVIRAKEPDASFLAVFAMIPGVPFSLAQMRKLGDDELTKPAETGPYLVDSYTPSTGWVWVKNPNYWGPKELAPFPDRIDYAGPDDHNVRAASFEAGDFDVVWFGNSDANTKRLAADKKFQQKSLAVAPFTLQFNHAKPPLDNLKLRQALASAVDRKKIFDIVYRGQGGIAKTGMLAPGTFGALEYEKYPFDLKKAKEYLDASGVRTPVKLSYIYSGAGTEETLLSAQIYQETMKAIGIEIEIVNQPASGVADSMYRNGEYHLTTGSTGVRPDPSPAFGLVLASWGSLNAGGKTSTDPAQKQIDDLIRRSMAEFDRSGREKIFHEITRVSNDNVIARIQVADRLRWLFAQPAIGGMDHPEVVNAPGGAGYRPRFLWKKPR